MAAVPAPRRVPNGSEISPLSTAGQIVHAWSRQRKDEHRRKARKTKSLTCNNKTGHGCSASAWPPRAVLLPIAGSIPSTCSRTSGAAPIGTDTERRTLRSLTSLNLGEPRLADASTFALRLRSCICDSPGRLPAFRCRENWLRASLDRGPRLSSEI